MRAYSQELRSRILHAVDQGKPRVEIVTTLFDGSFFSPATVIRLASSEWLSRLNEPAWNCGIVKYQHKSRIASERTPLASYKPAPTCDRWRTCDLAMEMALHLYWKKWLRQYG